MPVRNILKSKICIAAPYCSSFMGVYIPKIAKELAERGDYDVHVYSSSTLAERIKKVTVHFDDKLHYIYSRSDPRIYQGIFEYLDNNDIKKIFVPRLSHPEFLYSELLYRKSDIDIVFSVFAFELFKTSAARNNIMWELIRDDRVVKVLVHSVLGDALEFPRIFLKYPELITKIKFVSEPMYETLETYKTSNISVEEASKNFKLLFFGNIFFGKGLDILLEAAKHLIDDVSITLAGNFDERNFTLEIPSEKNVVTINRHIPEEEMIQLFCSTDIVVMPYRKTYEFGTSGVLVQAALANKPVLVPDIYPFNRVIERFGCGETFEAENPLDLAAKIKMMKNNGKEKYQLGLESYRRSLHPWAHFATYV
jgi:glycosyltransferase involved in cell wall biosynthesis